ncbi:hypothetical protein FACS1894193_06910 [Bacilli bacterium]|nr:hypothetical protein FACS1894193_06910 [Bacilli bacterium]
MSERLIKSKQRVQKHGEVFTPRWMVDKMLDVQGVKEATEDVTKTFLDIIIAKLIQSNWLNGLIDGLSARGCEKKVFYLPLFAFVILLGFKGCVGCVLQAGRYVPPNPPR